MKTLKKVHLVKRFFQGVYIYGSPVPDIENNSQIAMEYLRDMGLKFPIFDENIPQVKALCDAHGVELIITEERI